MSSKFSTTEHKRVVVQKDGREWLTVQRLHYTEGMVELVLIRQGDKRLELVLTEEEAWMLVDTVRKALTKPSEPHSDADVVGEAYEACRSKE
jgi:hypothetical protein